MQGYAVERLTPFKFSETPEVAKYQSRPGNYRGPGQSTFMPVDINDLLYGALCAMVASWEMPRNSSLSEWIRYIGARTPIWDIGCNTLGMMRGYYPI